MTAELDRGLTALRTQFAAAINSGAITSLGTFNCRRKNNTATGPWSEHAWPNAVDVMLRAGTTRKPTGDAVAAWMRSCPDLWSEVFWQVVNHFDHVHGTANPQRNYDNRQVPPCAGGTPIPPGDDEMSLVARLMVVEAGAKTWLPTQADIDYWMLRADNLDNPTYAAEWRRDFEQMWAKQKQDEYLKLAGHPHGAPLKGDKGDKGDPGAGGVTEGRVKEIISTIIAP